MPLQLISRDAELSAVDDLLSAVPAGTCVLVLEGDVGIGKSTVWRAGIERARTRGFRVLAAHPVSSESVAAYSSLAELLADVDTEVLDHLPAPQRVAIDRVLSRADDTGPGTDQRAVAAAVRSVLERLAQDSPVLVAIDDLQWLDPPTAAVLASVARRSAGAIGFLVTVRAGDGDRTETVLEPSRPERLYRARVHPLTVGGLHAMITHQLGRSLTRPRMDWVYEISAGNPLYALELARALNRDAAGVGPLPATLAELVRTRISGLPDHTREVLLATACIASPTVDLVARAVGDNVEWTVAALEEAERHGIVEITGYTVTFSHPLLARGVYAEASADERRWMHRRLADIVESPESRARHRALASDGADEQTVKALDEAAESAHRRGAPAAAAELLDMARARGGDTPERSLRAAGCHFEAGDTAMSRELLEKLISRSDPGDFRASALQLLGLVRLYDNSSAEAVPLLERAIDEPGVDVDRRVQMLVMLAFIEFNAGWPDRAIRRAEQAVAQAMTLRRTDLLTQARSMRAGVRFLLGEGFDEAELEGVSDDEIEGLPLAAQPRTLRAMLMLWTGRLDEAAEQFTAIAERCIERGDESERAFLDFHLAQVNLWRADLVAAERVADESVEWALQSHGDLSLLLALVVRVLASSHLGRVEDTRRFAAQAFTVGERCQSSRLGVWVVASLGFLELSLGDHRAAVEVLSPAVEGWAAAATGIPGPTELITAPFLPDAAEALIGVGRLDDAERLVDALEANGTRLDRPWMLALGARCRALLLAARGDLTAAVTVGERALTEHGRLSMPFELARTQLVVGRLQHRRRQYDAATATVSTALAAFERIGAELWARQARAELDALTGRQTAAGLAESERRFADLAVQGMTNREIAATLYVSEKTVEANLSRVYRRLGIRSRGELARVLNADS